MNDVLAYGIRETNARGEQFYRSLMNWIFSGRPEHGRRAVLAMASTYDNALRRSLLFLKGVEPTDAVHEEVELCLRHQRGLWSDLERVSKITPVICEPAVALESADHSPKIVPLMAEPAGYIYDRP